MCFIEPCPAGSELCCFYKLILSARLEALEGVVGDSDRHVRREDLGLGGQGDVRERSRARRRLVDHEPGRGDLDAHVREHPLHPLELGERPAELLAPPT